VKRSYAQSGRVTLPALLLALGVGAMAYASIKYVPLYRDHARLKSMVAEAGQRAIRQGDQSSARAWFNQELLDRGFEWLHADQLYWQPGDRHHLDVGVNYSVEVDHVIGRQEVSFAWYCTATTDECAPFTPTFSE